MGPGREMGGKMGMTGDTTKIRVLTVICPSCGEEYDTPERVTEILRNSGFCVNLTCLQDLSAEPPLPESTPVDRPGLTQGVRHGKTES